MKEHVVLSLERYGELIQHDKEYKRINGKYQNMLAKATRLETLAVECAIDLYKLESQNLQQSLHLNSDAWRVIPAEKMEMLHDQGINGGFIEGVIRTTYKKLKKERKCYDDRP